MKNWLDCWSENLQGVNMFGLSLCYSTLFHYLEILLVHSECTDLLHMKYMYDGFLFLDDGRSKFSNTLTHGMDESGW